MQIIAEIGSVHDGSYGNALALIEAAALAGADTVKFQTHIAEAETLPDAPNPGYFQAEPRYAYFQRTAFSPTQWQGLAACASDNGVQLLSSPFSLEAVSLLEEIGIAAYKIPSGEVTNHALLQKVAQTGKPVLLSSGMSNWYELDSAVALLKSGGPLTLLQCSSLYPCPPEKIGLNVLAELRERYNLPVGFSDHSLGLAAACAATAQGAVVIEKHFTFSRSMYGSDAKNAMEPAEFQQLSQAVRDINTMLVNPVNKDDLSPYLEMKQIFEKSIVTNEALPAGTTLTLEHLAFKKPGDGISASQYINVVGSTLQTDVRKNHKLQQKDFKS